LPIHSIHKDGGSDKYVINFARNKRFGLVYVGRRWMERNTTVCIERERERERERKAWSLFITTIPVASVQQNISTRDRLVGNPI
jgi:hypothetical protein